MDTLPAWLYGYALELRALAWLIRSERNSTMLQAGKGCFDNREGCFVCGKKSGFRIAALKLKKRRG